MMSDRIEIKLCDGKYTYIRDEHGQRALRYGEPWRDFVGDKFILAMAQEIEELRSEVKFLDCLRVAGVDNWEGYSEAQNMMDEDDE